MRTVVVWGAMAAMASVSAAAAPAAKTPRRPLYLTFHIHGHNFFMGAPAARPQKARAYEQHRAELIWIRETANRYGAKVSFQCAGEYAEWCIAEGQQADVQAYLDQGHTLGVHFHNEERFGELNWGRAQGPANDLEVLARIWRDNVEWVRRILPDYTISRLDAPMDRTAPQFQDWMRSYGMTLAAAPENQITGFQGHFKFGHHVWNPYWMKMASLLEEDPEGTVVAIPFLPQLGRESGAGVHNGLVLLVPQVKRRLLMCFLEWRHQGLAGLPDRIWTFGWLTHLDQNPRYHAEVEEMFRWAKEMFVEAPAPWGGPTAVFASDREVAEELVQWEKANPGLSSFSWKEGDSYPYSFPDMPKILENSAFEEEIGDWRPQGVRCFRLTGSHWPEPQKGQPIFILFSDKEETTIDLSSYASGPLEARDGKGGSVAVEDGRIRVGAEPVFVVPAGYVARPAPTEGRGFRAGGPGPRRPPAL